MRLEKQTIIKELKGKTREALNQVYEGMHGESLCLIPEHSGVRPWVAMKFLR